MFGSSSPVAGAEHVGPLGRVLGVWAHPDDETYLSGGLMAIAHTAGQPVACLHATDGEHGTDDPHRWPPRVLAVERRRELAGALDVLGVSARYRLGYADGSLASVDPDEGVDRVLAVLRAVQPDTIVTFGPDGITGHRDHCTIGAWTTSAAVLYGCADVLYATTAEPTLEAGDEARADIIDGFRLGGGAGPPTGGTAFELVLDETVLDRKARALEHHATQVAPVVAAMGRTAWRALLRREAFRCGLRSFASSHRR